MTMRRVLKLCVATAVLLAGAGCSVLPEKAPLTVYKLPLPLAIPAISHAAALKNTDSVSSIGIDPMASKGNTEHASDNSIRILMPTSTALLNSDRILVSRSAYQVSAYKGVRWQDQIPRMLRLHLAQALKNNGRWQAVITDGNTARTRYQLAGELLDFQVYEDAEGRAVKVGFDATLINVNDNRVIAARLFLINQPVTGPDFDQVIASFSTATERLGSEVNAWVQLNTVQSAN